MKWNKLQMIIISYLYIHMVYRNNFKFPAHVEREIVEFIRTSEQASNMDFPESTQLVALIKNTYTL